VSRPELAADSMGLNRNQTVSSPRTAPQLSTCGGAVRE
jgi:hypothetical protein